MICEVQETTGWSSTGSTDVLYDIYVNEGFPNELDYEALKELASVINQYIERKEAEK